MNYDSTDKTAFLAIMGLTVLTGVILYFVFAKVTPVPGTVNSIYRVELTCTIGSKCSASGQSGAAASAPVDESKFTKKVTINILKGASTQGNPSYGPILLLLLAMH